MRETRYVTISVPDGAVTIKKVNALIGVPKGARLLAAACSAAGLVTIESGTGASTIVLQVGSAGSGEYGSVDVADGIPVQWGEGADEALYITTAASTLRAFLVFVSEREG